MTTDPGHDAAERLARCFCEVFPHLSEERAREACFSVMDEWDSLASLSLVAVVEDEFGVTLPDETVANLDSYARILDAVRALPPSR